MRKYTDEYNQKKGVLIVFEGLSGSGKSRNAGVLLDDLRSKGYDPLLIEWNSNAAIRSFVAWLDSRNKLSANIYSLLQWIGFLIDYFRTILPALRSSRIVIADRYVHTGLVRDSVNGAGKKLGRMIAFLVWKPDRIYFIDVPPGICLERLAARNTALFHTNRLIAGNRLLKNKDLYYLNKMRYEYNRMLADTKLVRPDIILRLDSENEAIEWHIERQVYLSQINNIRRT